jgi:hypothetical protein
MMRKHHEMTPNLFMLRKIAVSRPWPILKRLLVGCFAYLCRCVCAILYTSRETAIVERSVTLHIFSHIAIFSEYKLSKSDRYFSVSSPTPLSSSIYICTRRNLSHVCLAFSALNLTWSISIFYSLLSRR